MKIIRNENELDNWLDKNFGFEDGYISELVMVDEVTVKLRMGYQIEGSYVAGTPKLLKEYLIVAKGVKDFNDNYKVNPDHCMEGVFQIKTINGIGIELDAPEIIHLYCDELYIEEPIYVKVNTKAWISDHDLNAKVPKIEIPKPIFWLEELEKRGFDVSWRYGGSDIKLAEQVPYPDYSGWFIQETNKIKNTQFGVFIRHIRLDKEGFYISIERHEVAVDLWDGIIRIIAELPDVEISIGNCILTGAQWINYINSGDLPY
jgi:hypothetical protein